MGHAGAIIMGSSGRWQDKVEALREAGAVICESPTQIGETVKKIVEEKGIS